MFKTYSIINFEEPIKPINTRSCNGCTSCCEGWLSCNIYGQEVNLGKPCKFLDKSFGCSAYDLRPYDPCKTFLCYWKIDRTIPEHFKPSISKTIMIYRRSVENINHLDLVDAGKPISTEILSFALSLFQSKKVDSVRWWVKGKMNYVSRDEKFIQAIDKSLDVNMLELRTRKLLSKSVG